MPIIGELSIITGKMGPSQMDRSASITAVLPWSSADATIGFSAPHIAEDSAKLSFVNRPHKRLGGTLVMLTTTTADQAG